MAMSDNGRRKEYIADGSTATYAYDFEIFESSDLNVYLDGVLTAAYNVTGVGNNDGGTIVFTSTPAADVQIIINSNIPYDQTVDYSVGGKLQPITLNFVNDKLTALIQQVNSLIINRGLYYPENTYLDNSISSKDNVLPVLSAKTGSNIPIWSKNTDGNIIATSLAESSTMATLRTDLANNGNGTDGAGLVGYYNATSPTDNTVRKALTNIYASITPQVNSSINRNLLIAGDFVVNPWQRGVSFTGATTPNNNDGTYTADRWALLSDGNDIVDITQDSDKSYKFDVQTINKQFGIVQFLESKDVLSRRGGKVSLTIKLKSSFSANVRVGILNWTGTTDAPTKDVVGTWNGGGVNPTLVAGYAYANTPSNLATTASYQTFEIENITVSASANNLAVFVWVDNTTIAAASTLNILNVKLEDGVLATGLNARNFGEELLLCQRYYEKSYNPDIKPGTIQNDGTINVVLLSGTSSIWGLIGQYKASKFYRIGSLPTLTWYSPITGASNSVYDFSHATDRTVNATDFPGVNNTGQPSITAISGLTGIRAHWTSEFEVGV
jgi:hypothetical protein